MFHLTVATCKDVSSFGRGPTSYALVCLSGSLLPRCSILRWLPAKMFHLLVGDLVPMLFFGSLLPILFSHM